MGETFKLQADYQALFEGFQKLFDSFQSYCLSLQTLTFMSKSSDVHWIF